MQRVQELAELTVLVGELRAAKLRGEYVDLLELTRLTNSVRRIRDDLGLGGEPPPAPDLTLDELLKGKRRRSGR
jgi:hypothetical protein